MTLKQIAVLEPEGRRLLARRIAYRRRGMTVEQYFDTPESLDPTDLLFGQIMVRDAPTVSHQRVVLELAVALREYALDHGGEVLLSPTDVVLDEPRALILQPDLSFVKRGGAARIGDHVEGPPDVVAEVISPSQSQREIWQRVGWYAQYGVQEVWLMPVGRGIEVVTCGRGRVEHRRHVPYGELLESRVLPGLALDTARLLGWQ